MPLSDFKISAADRNKGVKSAPDTLSGTPQANKNIFDALTDYIADSYNLALDALSAPTGAAQLGAAVSGVAGTDVAAVLAALKALLDERYTKTEVAAAFYTKELVDVMLRKNIEQGGSTGSLVQNIVVAGTLLTIQYYDGTQAVVDTSKVSQTVTRTAVLTAADWTGTAPPYTQKINVDGLGLATNGIIGPATNATKAERDACAFAQIAPTAQEVGGVVISALIEKPTINIPIMITIWG